MSFPQDRELSELATKEGRAFATVVEAQLIVDELASKATTFDPTDEGRAARQAFAFSALIGALLGFPASKIRAHAQSIRQHIQQELTEHEQQQK